MSVLELVLPLAHECRHTAKKIIFSLAQHKTNPRNRYQADRDWSCHIGLGNRNQAPPLTLTDRPSSDASVGTLFSLVARVCFE